MTDRASTEGLRTDHSDALHRAGYRADCPACIANDAAIAALRSDSDSGTHGHDVPGVGYLWWDASGKIIGGPEDD